MAINKQLAEEKNLSDFTIETIEKIHKELEALLNLGIEDIKDVNKYVQDITNYDYDLQRLWNFPQDRAYHSYWFRAKACDCAVLDNQDMIGTGYRSINADCPLHGLKDK